MSWIDFESLLLIGSASPWFVHKLHRLANVKCVFAICTFANNTPLIWSLGQVISLIADTRPMFILLCHAFVPVKVHLLKSCSFCSAAYLWPGACQVSLCTALSSFFSCSHISIHLPFCFLSKQTVEIGWSIFSDQGRTGFVTHKSNRMCVPKTEVWL